MPADSGFQKQIILKILGVAAFIGWNVLFFRYLYGAFCPFIIAFAVAALFQNKITFLQQRYRIPKLLSAILFVVLFLIGLFAVFWLLFEKAAHEMTDLLQMLTFDFSEVSGKISLLGEKISAVFTKIPVLSWGQSHIDIQSALRDIVISFFSQITERLSLLLTHTVKSFPQTLLFFFMFILSFVYFSVDFEKIKVFFEKCLFLFFKKSALSVKHAGLSSLLKLAKAYLILLFLTFSELLFGLLLMRQKYAFVLALLIAAIDILPVLGTGTALIPWSIFLFAIGNRQKGIAVLLLYIVITIVRQITEPRLIGKGLGLPPIIMLMAMYAGLKWGGGVGMLGVPLSLALFYPVLQTLFSLRENEA